jgi:hypothetical protein
MVMWEYAVQPFTNVLVFSLCFPFIALWALVESRMT